MRRKALLVLFAVVVLAVIGFYFVLPGIDQEMMKTPVVNAMNAVRDGDMKALRACFTQTATVDVAKPDVPVDAVIAKNRGDLESGALREQSMRFGGYTNAKYDSPTEVSADFTVIAYVEGGDAYRRVPYEVKGHVVLEKQGFLQWKIKHIRVNEELGGIVK